MEGRSLLFKELRLKRVKRKAIDYLNLVVYGSLALVLELGLFILLGII
jgi:hypothetical protein